MSAPVLSKKEQKKSLSGIKNRKKKVMKNILAAPSTAKISKPIVDATEISKIYEALKTLLPSARLSKESEKSESSSEKNSDSSAEVGLKRKQLLLGINSVSRGISNGSIASVIFANDIKPKLLISPLILLCSLKNIPYIYLENFRMLTKDTLGFSSIALGFKKDSTFFSSVNMLITSAVQMQNCNSTIGNKSNENVDTPITEDCEEKRMTCETVVKNIKDFVVEISDEKSKACEKVQNTFDYLHRDSSKKRVFSPDADSINQQQHNNKDFIPLGTDDEITRTVPVKIGNKISEGKAFRLDAAAVNEKKAKNSRKKRKRHFPTEYLATQTIKMGANPDREKKNYKKMKKGKNI